MLSVLTPPETNIVDQPKKRSRRTSIYVTFSEVDLEGMSQSHDVALVVTSQIGRFLVKRVMINQGNGAEIIYPDLYKGLRLKPKDLSRYNTPLVGIDGRIMTLEGQIKPLVVTKGKEMEVNFIVVNAFSPYTTILGNPWIHVMGAVPSTLHQKFKFPSENGVSIV
ncbi:uncharacterized protein LOC142635777 [Castanea sativa]|uniref:uncharacterized protein LOC142635777 n=1 Tax=Castanea sativa TaxID=21020 RepID=UPI003F64C6CE